MSFGEEIWRGLFIVEGFEVGLALRRNFVGFIKFFVGGGFFCGYRIICLG